MKANITVQNLKCGGCENTIITKLSLIEGVSKVIVHPQESIINLEYANPETLKKVKQVLKAIGYPDVNSHNNFIHKAKSYVSCAMGRFSSTPK